jgi:hypothetical protein
MSAKVRTAALAAAIIGAGVFAIGLVSGFFTARYSVRGTGSVFPQIGRSVDIGGRMLNIYDSVRASRQSSLKVAPRGLSTARQRRRSKKRRPTTRLQLGTDSGRVGKLTTACWYDRAGSGWSDLANVSSHSPWDSLLTKVDQ